MIGRAHLLLLLLLVSMAAGQAAVTNCGASALTGIASGIIVLGVPTAPVAQTSYSLPLTNFNLNTHAEVFHAFAIAGFQGASNQQFFSIMVDQVIFQNDNKLMNFTMNYANLAGTFTSTWSTVKLSWLAVSTAFETFDGNFGNMIYATTALLKPPYSSLADAKLINSVFLNNPADRASNLFCGYVNTSPPWFDLYCPPGNVATSQNFMTHVYIMGFQFNSAGTYSLAASALRLAGDNTALAMDEAIRGNDIVHQQAIKAAPPTQGPKILLDSTLSQLEAVKISIVITVVLNAAVAAPGNYPNVNSYNFQYAGVYMDFTLYNTQQPIVQTTAARGTAGQQNWNYFTLLSPKYQIFGLSQFYIEKLPASVTVINYELSLPGSSTVLFQTDNVNYMRKVRVSADQWSKKPSTVCTINTVVERQIVKKSYYTVPPIQSIQQNIYEVSQDLDFNYFVAGSYQINAANALSSTVVFSNILTFEQISIGSPYEINFVISAPTHVVFPLGNAAGTSVQYSVKVEGNQILTAVNTFAAGAPSASTYTHRIGYAFSVSNPSIEIVITVPRVRNDAATIAGSLDNTYKTVMVLTKYSAAYNPLTDCCDTTCPAGSGVSLGVSPNPPMCIFCGVGLVYNSVTRLCQCQTGHYTVTQTATGQVNCFPCFAPLCQNCLQATPNECASCVPGATLNATNKYCFCNPGFWQNSTLCAACPIRCQNCSSGTVCTTCSDNTTRSITNNCNCLDGFFEGGSAICDKCPVLCRTCSSATTCTSCFTELRRGLHQGQCVCTTGFYQVVASNGSLTCEPCSPSCINCSLTADRCTNCDPASNRILGYDSTGAQVCNCIPGYFPNSNQQCVQSNCTADPYCSTCLTVLNTPVCIKCIAATMRVLVLPQQKCFCQDGFYDNQGSCDPCSTGCAKCSALNVCSQCVVSANTNNDGSCRCPDGFFFTTSPIRHCRRCPNYTLTCLSSLQALTCVANFDLQNGACVCPSGRFIDNLGQCQPCVQGCAICNSSTTCISCNTPLLLQGSVCVTRCGPGFFQNGFVCTPCSPGCAMCQGPNICLICLSGQLAYNGFCYKNCPAGSVQGNSSSCVDCNSPCKTCTEHPSKCTSCQSCCGNLFNYKCLESCPVGTYSINGTCQYCAYTCKTCIGSNITCTSCPDTKILFNGACYDKCPYLMIGGVCTFNCAKGLYKTQMNECLACDSRCLTCDKVASNCTACKPEFGFALNGLCVKNCPLNFLSLDGECKPCNPECKGCIGTCSSCIECAVGYYKLGSNCVKTCYPNMFIDNRANLCISCSDKCKTCSSLTFCTTCANPQAVPVNGVCNDCSYPCKTCTAAPSSCTSCVDGFNLIGTTCIAACPQGAFPKNGVCVCNNGFIFSNQCVAKCPIGFGNVGGQCQKCLDNCAACEGSKDVCTECLNGYALDQVSGVCQKAPTCQFGQYFSQSNNGCTRICPQNTYFYENVCLTACLSGFQDNGVGGCVASTPQTGCSFPYFLSNGICVSNCPSGFYPDTQNRICKACSSNCFSCLTNTFCYACNAGYDLNKGVCIKATLNCPANEFRYNGVCYSQCPAGTCERGNFCQRTCPAGTWAYNGGCYRTCPTKLTTADACVNSCPANTALVNGVCQVGSQSCPSGQYWDGSASACRPCTYPCSECSLAASYCTVCASGLKLNGNMCVSTTNSCGRGRFSDASGSCQNCPAKCLECIDANICSACASGFNYNGVDCVKAVGQLRPISLSTKSTSKRGNTAYITVCPNIIPNGLSVEQQGSFFTVVSQNAASNDIAYINQWLSSIDQGCVTVAVNYNKFPVSSGVFLAINQQLLASTYLGIGFIADSSSYVSVPININLADAPANLVAPVTANAVRAASSSDIPIASAVYMAASQFDSKLD